MKYTVYDRLLKREVGQQRKKYTDIRGIYGDRKWIEDMDIVNELEGHHGCVNALSWSTSGRLLASGSDDHRINIYSYHPDSSTSQFSLNTTIMTHHRSNIFSVKFMPYSNDRTIVSATDDVRVFDIEHSGHTALSPGSRSGSAGHSRGMARGGLTLTEADTNAKAFRCHTDTVKRIVTEDNPFYFLTCSNDGDIRQWDVRQPSNAYPRGKDMMAPRWARDADASDNVPPPLISYSRHGLDLNTVSCSPSQPHYIALGGAHLHCFLHDRRMLGRDKSYERGSRFSSPAGVNEKDEELLGKATQCVKKFAPNGKQRMKRKDSGHITACKISDAYPNELIVSWSQDHIYSFDMLRSPDVSEKIVPTQVRNGDTSSRVREHNKKRKRTKSGMSLQEGSERGGSKQRTEPTDDDLAIRVFYGNGQSEDIRIETPAEGHLSREELVALKSTDHYRIAKTLLTVAKRMWDTRELGENGLKLNFTSIVGFANSILADMDDIARKWGYPVDPNPVDVAVQNRLRDARASARRFVQAAGTLARVLGGQLLTGSNSDALISQYFASIHPAPRERELPRHEQFVYDFLKAILLWLDSGPSAVVEGFSSRSGSERLPIPQDSDIDAIEEFLVPYLLELASDDPILNVDVSKYETDDRRILLSSEKMAVQAWAKAVKLPFADLTGAEASTTSAPRGNDPVLDRGITKRRWAYLIGRGLLLNAFKGISFALVDRAFGGRGIADKKVRDEEKALREQQEDIDPLDDDGPVVDAELISESSARAGSEIGSLASSISTTSESTGSDNGTVAEVMEYEDEAEDEDSDKEDDDHGADVDSEEDEEESDSEDEDEEGLRRTRSGRMLWRSEFGRSRYKREMVEQDVPCTPHTRVYSGHCNVKTVKDVSYFGLQDEYVVSGSDSGHVFIWDRKTAQLINILEGDGEVVNVVQGHPYEPTMAVSGIDHTIKIFSPDTFLQRNARRGIGVQSSDPTSFSSLNFRGRRRHAQQAAPERTTRTSGEGIDDASDNNSSDDEEVAAGGLSSKKRFHQAYEITSKNDMDRKGGREDYFISQAVLAQLARHISAQQGGGGEGEEGDGGPIIITEDNCAVM